MRTTDLLEPARVSLGVTASSKKRVIEIVAAALAEGSGAPAELSVLESLLSRERLGSTAVGHGVALPHGRVAGIDASRGAFLRLAEPIDFGAPDGLPVDLVFGLVVPQRCEDEHLAALAAIAARFEDGALRDALRATDDPAHALALLTG